MCSGSRAGRTGRPSSADLPDGEDPDWAVVLARRRGECLARAARSARSRPSGRSWPAEHKADQVDARLCGAEPGIDGGQRWVLSNLAAVWGDHPDYRAEWAPRSRKPPLRPARLGLREVSRSARFRRLHAVLAGCSSPPAPAPPAAYNGCVTLKAFEVALGGAPPAGAALRAVEKAARPSGSLTGAVANWERDARDDEAGFLRDDAMIIDGDCDTVMVVNVVPLG